MKKLVQYASSWVEIDKEALLSNLMLYKRCAPEAFFAPVIKSNAYGHGISLIADILDQSPVVDMLCVVALSEALLLRSQNIKKDILVLSIIDQDLNQAVLQNIDVVLYELETARELSATAQKLGLTARIHIKIDTGLSRLGILADQALPIIKQIDALPGIYIRGIFSHLANSEEEHTFAKKQLEKFLKLIQDLENSNIVIPLQHISCSAALSALPLLPKSMVRLGLGLYGLWPSAENKKSTQELYPDFQLKPVLSWKTRIIQIKTIPAGSSVGYGRTHYVSKDTRIAILPVGYWDGYDRRLSNKVSVSINNQEAPVLGRIAMNLTMVDITDLSVELSDHVILLGLPEYASAENLASLCGTINYEFVTRINPLLIRTVK